MYENVVQNSARKMKIIIWNYRCLCTFIRLIVDRPHNRFTNLYVDKRDMVTFDHYKWVLYDLLSVILIDFQFELLTSPCVRVHQCGRKNWLWTSRAVGYSQFTALNYIIRWKLNADSSQNFLNGISLHVTSVFLL